MELSTKLQFFFSGGSPTPVGLLNTTGGAGADWAYSPMMLNADLIGEEAIEVRRATDNAVARFNLTPTGFDFPEIMSFLGTAKGYVPWTLDQSGNGRHGVSDQASKQPVIANNGAISQLNGMPVFGRDTVVDVIGVFGYQPNGAERQVYYVGNSNGFSNFCLFGNQEGKGDYAYIGIQGSFDTSTTFNPTLANEKLNGSPFLYSTRNHVYQAFLTQSLLSFDITTNYDDNSLYLGYRPDNTITGMLQTQAAIMYPAPKSASERLFIENYLNQYYGIF